MHEAMKALEGCDTVARKEIQIVCKSIFKNGSDTSKNQFTKKWVEMINQLEKKKKLNNYKP
jgi:hemerythrin-like domain-containing protein